MKFKEYAKALVAALIAGLSSLATLLTSAHDNFSEITSTGWITVIVSTLVAAGAVWGVPNASKPVEDKTSWDDTDDWDDVDEPDAYDEAGTFDDSGSY